ncbi:tetratricopeptide repeat protein [candidate division KSB1 bacterium]
MYSAQYNEAIQHFRQLEDIDPECTEGIFFEAFVLELLMDVYRSQVFDDSLNKVVERALLKGEKSVEKNPTGRNNMFIGGLYGVRGVRKGILGDWWGAAWDGRRAFKYMEKSIKLAPDIYDCYYGIGSYHYWRTKKLRRFFPFISDERQKGIEELNMAIDKGIFAKTPARMALFRIYIEEKQYDRVIDLANIVLRENPDHIFPRWYLGIALIRTKQWEKAIENYRIILDNLQHVSFRGVEADIEARYYTGLSYYNLGEPAKAKEFLKGLPQLDSQVNKNLFYYDDYIKESKKLLEKIDKSSSSGR